MYKRQEEFGALAKELGLTLQTVYFGGGTPTTLDAAQLSALFGAIERSFDLSHLLEYTVEAGRPDTCLLYTSWYNKFYSCEKKAGERR